MITHSWTSLEKYDQCPEAARRLFVLRDVKRQPYQPGINVHEHLEARVKSRTPLPAELVTAEPFVQAFERYGKVEAEVKMALDLWLEPCGYWSAKNGKDPWFRTTPDVIVRRGDKALIADWKSGKVREKQGQLELNALALMRHDLSINTVVGMNVWLQTGKSGEAYTFTRAEASPRWAYWVKLMREIDAKPTGEVWEKRKTGLCPWCPVDSCENFTGGLGRG